MGARHRCEASLLTPLPVDNHGSNLGVVGCHGVFAPAGALDDTILR